MMKMSIKVKSVVGTLLSRANWRVRGNASG